METTSLTRLNPAFLPPGTLVGSWRVVDWAGGGVYGAVYRAVRAGAEHTPPVALKLALIPGDPRFAREVELLSRQRHPHLPHLVDHGEWQHPDGTLHPYIAMEWVDGVPLYDWARLYRPDSAQQLRMLAQVALALQALHAQEAVHRDVKGANILVRRWDGRVFLTDLGASTYPGADTLTPPGLHPGTPAYRSPEAWQYSVKHGRTATEPYRARPADDLFALGVTACRLVTGIYPELGEGRRDEHGLWSVESLVLPHALFSDRVEAPLRELILRMLSIRPETRGTAMRLARDMERAAATLTACRVSTSLRTQPSGDDQRSGSLTSRVLAHLRVEARSWRVWLATATAMGALATWAWLAREAPENRFRTATKEEGSAGPTNGGSAGLGEAVASALPADAPVPSVPGAMLADTPPEPEPGQARPDAKGRCPHKEQVALNDGCWRKTSFEPDQCESFGGYRYQGACYVPILAPKRHSSTTAPTMRLPRDHEGSKQP